MSTMVAVLVVLAMTLPSLPSNAEVVETDERRTAVEFHLGLGGPYGVAGASLSYSLLPRLVLHGGIGVQGYWRESENLSSAAVLGLRALLLKIGGGGIEFGLSGSANTSENKRIFPEVSLKIPASHTTVFRLTTGIGANHASGESVSGTEAFFQVSLSRSIGDSPTENVVDDGADSENTLSTRRDNAFLAPTALTLTRGQFRIALYELVVPEVTFAPVDRITVSAMLSPASWIGRLVVKGRVLDAGAWHFALLGAGVTAQPVGALAGGGVVGTVCVTDDCGSHLSFHVVEMTGVTRRDSEAELRRSNQLIVGGSGVVRITTHLSLVAELRPILLPQPDAGALVRWEKRGFVIDAGVLTFDTGGFHGVIPAGSVSWAF